jgi:hypothetical protein
VAAQASTLGGAITSAGPASMSGVSRISVHIANGLWITVVRADANPFAGRAHVSHLEWRGVAWSWGLITTPPHDGFPTGFDAGPSRCRASRCRCRWTATVVRA